MLHHPGKFVLSAAASNNFLDWPVLSSEPNISFRNADSRWTLWSCIAYAAPSLPPPGHLARTSCWPGWSGEATSVVGLLSKVLVEATIRP